MAQEKLTFLEIYSTKRIKKEIQGICDSYSHPWDILAELVQNSVDSIKKWNRDYSSKSNKKHFIDIKIDQRAKSISVTDSGTGIDLKKLPGLLAPNATDKDNDTDLVGEKGVGLKFAVFSSNKFTLETTSTRGKYFCELNKSRDWLHSDADEKLDIEKDYVEEKEKDPTETYTKIELMDVGDAAEQIFVYDFNELSYILRTKTFIGFTGDIFKEEKLDVVVTLELINKAGQAEKKKIDFRYWLPSDFFSKNELTDINQYEKEAGKLNDAQRARRLSSKCLYSKDVVTLGGKKYWYYAFFVPSRDTWDRMAETAKLNRNINDEPLINHGIYVSTRGMPTGIEVVPPRGGAMGFWAQLFILIEYDGFKFDIGRKAIPNKEKGLLRDIAKTQFNRFNGLWELVSGRAPIPRNPTITALQKSDYMAELEKLPNLGLKEIQFLKEPINQEAGVVAIFHELLGKGIIKGYHGLASAYKAPYDFWGKYHIEKEDLGKTIQGQIGNRKSLDVPVVIEFKYDAAYIIADVKRDKKHFEDIDVIVCWDIDTAAFGKEQIQVEPMNPDEVLWHGTNFKLVWPGTYNLGNSSEKPVISLRQFVDNHKRKQG